MQTIIGENVLTLLQQDREMSWKRKENIIIVVRKNQFLMRLSHVEDHAMMMIFLFTTNVLGKKKSWKNNEWDQNQNKLGIINFSKSLSLSHSSLTLLLTLFSIYKKLTLHTVFSHQQHHPSSESCSEKKLWDACHNNGKTLSSPLLLFFFTTLFLNLNFHLLMLFLLLLLVFPPLYIIMWMI